MIVTGIALTQAVRESWLPPVAVGATHKVCPTELDVLSVWMSGAEQSRACRAVSSITP